MDFEKQIVSSDDVIRLIMALGCPQTQETAQKLQDATRELIGIFKADGRLDESPMMLAMTRTVDLHRGAAAARLEGRRVLVTGGLGCVGSRLIPLLIGLGVQSVAIVDIADHPYKPDGPEKDGPQPKSYKVNICDAQALDAIFSALRPHVVFHLAGVREPGRAEAVVRDAIATNVFGTRNVIDACLRHDVEAAIYSSTGKCFAYVSDHVYAGSKKLAEAQWVDAGRRSTSTHFRCTRFTHIMENGLVTQDIFDGIDDGMVALHGPDRNFNVQNRRQATHLLINALALADETPPDGFWSAIDLGWPVNTLELALYTIDRSGKPAGIWFQGVPKGYDEVFFRGQFGWDEGQEYHPLINALEALTMFHDHTGTMVGARIQNFDKQTLDRELEALRVALGDSRLGVDQVKGALLQAVAGLARAVFLEADLSRLVDILWWGAAPTWAGENGRDARRFQSVIRILSDVIAVRLSDEAPGAIGADVLRKLEEVGQTLALIDGLAQQHSMLQQVFVQQPWTAVMGGGGVQASRAGV
ncbi:polysaccharide biosynthesis protein [Bradyrhizobium sp. JYMT SZCCT0428]|uniref:polysaccharide biosynthesis protein n=1 Tax=Bradyrhizobium sp. JYMT SZCCT0428 TaxID=2807673 RepID=UPI001BAD2212|nr:polysaccharide biosynthesis protein [Bradyrhizobium sp. JYMT SZCCT0428]MBR1156525.1 polysaccharide biosynthesis protein [Bradyrhizobium sp. JYMT SZCCT0428]